MKIITHFSFLILCFFTTIKNYSQQGVCVEITNPVYEANKQSLAIEHPIFGGHSPNSTLQTPDGVTYPDEFPGRIYVYKLVFHVVRNSIGVRQSGNIGEEQVMNIVRDLNLKYKQFGIFFKYKGFDYIDDSNLVGDFWGTQLDETGPFGSYISNDKFHITILDGSILGYDENSNVVPTPGLGFRYSTVAFLNYEGATSTRIPAHEIGHCFNLYHDFRNYGSIDSSEKVTRNSNTEGYNANFAGYGVYDTPASRAWSFNTNNYSSDGYYIGEDLDYNVALPETDYERFFRNYPPRINNLMHVHEGQDIAIPYQLSQGQGKRIRWSIALDATNNYGIWSLAKTKSAELYQPFETVYLPGINAITVDDNNDGTATVCYPRIIRNRFQKGLNYVFENAFTNTPEENPVFDQGSPNDLKEIDRDFDFNIKVLDIDANEKILFPIDCNRMLICVIEEYISGRLLSTQVLGSMNLTIQELNQIQVKDPNLYNSLMNEYYYILKKMTSTGAIVQKVFYKE